MGSTKTATAGGREFKDSSWNGVISRVVAAYNLKTTTSERVQAATELMDNNTTYVGGVRVVPQGR